MLNKITYLTIFIFFTYLIADDSDIYKSNSYGWNVPNSQLNIGGYLDMTYDDEREDKFLFNDIAMILSSHKERFDFLGEIELVNISPREESSSRSDVDIYLERVQLSYALSDEQTIQIGRFNSDIGYWNQAPIPILEDTTTKPHLIGHMFPKSTTGILYRQNLNGEDTLSFTLQDNHDIAHQDNLISINRHFGFSYHDVYDDFSLRLAGGLYREKDGINTTYLGVGAEYELDDFTMQGELFTQQSRDKEDSPYSGYFQSSWNFTKREDLVARFEAYDDKNIGMQEEIYLFGYLYRPWTNMALKIEYVYHTHLPLNRFVYSLSVLF